MTETSAYPLAAELAALASSAREALERLPDDSAPVVVELAGSPKSGKSTTIDIVSHFFHRCQFRVYAPSEGASKRTPYHLRRDLVAFNAWTLNYAISELLTAYYAVDRPHLVFLDRGPFDSVSWMSLLTKRGELSADELRIIIEFATHRKWVELIDRVYLFRCSPSTSLAREHEVKLIQASGTAMNEATLSALLEEYNEIEAELRASYPFQTIDTSSEKNTSPVSTSYEIASDILKLLRQRGAS